MSVEDDFEWTLEGESEIHNRQILEKTVDGNGSFTYLALGKSPKDGPTDLFRVLR